MCRVPRPIHCTPGGVSVPRAVPNRPQPSFRNVMGADPGQHMLARARAGSCHAPRPRALRCARLWPMVCPTLLGHGMGPTLAQGGTLSMLAHGRAMGRAPLYVGAGDLGAASPPLPYPAAWCALAGCMVAPCRMGPWARGNRARHPASRATRACSKIWTRRDNRPCLPGCADSFSCVVGPGSSYPEENRATARCGY